MRIITKLKTREKCTMDGPRFAALFAVMLGAFAMVVNFLALPMLFNKVANIQQQMQSRMETFRIVADQAWGEMMDIRKVYAGRLYRDVGDDYNPAVPFPFGYNPPTNGLQSLQSSLKPQTVEATPTFTPLPTLDNSIQTTKGPSVSDFEGTSSTCPPGPPGPPGEPGQDGVPGVVGADGLSGVNASEVKLFDEEMCLICPKGLPGPPGKTGPQGPNGIKGIKGEIGKKGLDGDLGKAGLSGMRGQPGIPGKPGTKGIAGKPAPGGKGEKGPKGARGPIGRAGPQGESGKANFSNLGMGVQGLPGKNGVNGTAGKIGPKGVQGPPGMVGSEGGFCPCPKELRKLGLLDNATTPIPPGDDAKSAVDSTVAPVANPPSFQPPSPTGIAPAGAHPPGSGGSPAIAADPSAALNVPNGLPVLAEPQMMNVGQNNLVQLP